MEKWEERESNGCFSFVLILSVCVSGVTNIILKYLIIKVKNIYK